MSEKKLMSLADMFGEEEKISNNSSGITEIDIINLIPFSNHPFKLYEGERFENMVRSIKELGIITPIIVRPQKDKHEILSGHNRVNAAKVAGLTKVPVIIKENLEDEEAMLIVTETNLMQRSFSDMLHSERATVLFEHHKALSSQGKRTDLLKEIETMLKADEIRDESASRLLGMKLSSADETGKNFNLSGRTVSRYLRVCNLITELKEKLDKLEIPFFSSVELSYLTEEEQYIIDNVTEKHRFKIELKKAETLRTYSDNKKLNEVTAYAILSGELNKKPKSNKQAAFKIKPKLINKYFTPDIKQPEIEDIIDKALGLYFETYGKEVLNE